MTATGSGRSREQKFHDLWRHAGRVTAFFVRRYGVNPETARDLMQDVYVRVYRNIDSYRGEAEWAFLERIAHNTARNDHRARTAQRRDGIDVQIDDLHEASLSHEDDDYATLDEQRRQRAQLHEAIARLSAAQRECLLLWLADQSYNEIQKTLKISEDAVKTRLKEAKARLKVLIGPQSGANALLDTLPEEDR
ncbi:MAG: hypothetical protein QOH21_438 [Acidobacteriota bacterium]|jgi:RNA polymerase sigma-70 factor (ECF subfamily)|nr:hypothetical protein [Acidobacteriota bacterium]